MQRSFKYMVKKRLKSKASTYAAPMMIVYIVIILVSFFVAWNLMLGGEWGQRSHAQRSQEVVEDVKQNLGTMLNLIQFYAEDGTNNNQDERLEYFYVLMKPMPDSYPVNYKNASVYFKDKYDVEQFFNYSDNINCSIMNAIDNRSIYNETNSNNFGFTLIKVANNMTYHAPDAFIPGNTGIFCFKTSTGIRDTNKITLRIIPYKGTEFRFVKETPDSFNKRTVFFHPIV